VLVGVNDVAVVAIEEFGDGSDEAALVAAGDEECRGDGRLRHDTSVEGHGLAVKGWVWGT
jgi:hypothetical protein